MLRRWLSHPKMGNDFLYGHEAKVWNETYDHDFIAMPRPEGEIERDGLSRLFLDQMVDLWQRGVGRFYKKGVTPDNPMVRYENRKVLRAANITSTLISSGLPIASIIALNFISRTIIRLVTVAVFTMAFSLILVLVTNARRVEVFAATAA
ncbi:hypothetical protein MMC21_005667 [Puttea exsequens]|nr:hypothetical protein [Puttea exsequens]